MFAPELQSMVDEYRRILQRLRDGELAVNDAWVELERLSAIDSYGAVWTLSADQGPDNPVFLRSEPGGGPALAADPTSFTPSVPVGDGFGEPRSQQGAWTDNPMDIVAPPSSGPTPGSQPAGAGADGSVWVDDTWSPSNAVFPDDTVVGNPVDTGWDPTMNRDFGDSDKGGAAGPEGDGGFVRTPGPTHVHSIPGENAGIVDRAKDFVGAAVAAVTSSRSGPRRKAVLVAVCAVALIAAVFAERRMSGDDDGFAYSCPEASYTVSNAGDLSEEVAALLGCLDDGSDLDAGDGSEGRGPYLAVIAVTAENGVLTYRPEVQVSNAQAAMTAARLYAFAGGPAASASVEADLSGVAPEVAADVQNAFDLSLVAPDGVVMTEAVSRGDQAVWLYRALTRTNVISDAAAGVRASDAPEGDPEPGQAVAALRAAGIVDGAAGDPFDFVSPLLVADWTLWAGRATHEIREPGSMALRVAEGDGAVDESPEVGDDGRPMAPGASGAPSAAPDSLRVEAAISAVTSGDEALVAQMVVDPGAGLDGAKRRALWAGLITAGASVSPQGPPAVDGGTAAQVWEVSGAGADTEVAVSWVLVDGVWLLEAVPEL